MLAARVSPAMVINAQHGIEVSSKRTFNEKEDCNKIYILPDSKIAFDYKNFNLILNCIKGVNK